MTDSTSPGQPAFCPRPWFAGLLLVLCYLYLGTGIHSDDYANIQLSEGWGLVDWLTLYKNSTTFFYYLPTLYFDFAQFAVYGYESAYYDVAKVFISFFSAVAAWAFAKQYLDETRAFLFSVLFVLYPTHDATNYWFTGTYLLMTGAWVMLSHALINAGRVAAGLGTGLLGAFWSYASPPLVGGLSLTFLLTRQYRKFVLFVLPEALYVAYYFAVSKVFDMSSFRTRDIASVSSLAKQFLLQVGSFLDAVVGPSFWLKTAFGIGSLAWLSILVAAVLVAAAWRLQPRQPAHVDRAFTVALLGVAALGFLIFAITGGYPQLAFNLGNRVTYYGSLLMALLIVALPFPRWVSVGLTAVVCFSAVGLSDHWKGWNDRQRAIMATIRANPELANVDGNILLVTGNQYSRLGTMSHIEFFSESYMASAVFHAALGKSPRYRVRTLNRRFHVDNGWLVDSKYDERLPLGASIAIYDSEKNRLDSVPVADIPRHIAALPSDTRHWIQSLDDGPLRSFMLFLMPRLRYAFL